MLCYNNNSIKWLTINITNINNKLLSQSSSLSLRLKNVEWGITWVV